MNFKSSVVNTSFGRCAEHTIEVSVHHRHLLSCRLLELYKQSLLFSPRSLIGASLWNSSALTMNIRMYLYMPRAVRGRFTFRDHLAMISKCSYNLCYYFRFKSNVSWFRSKGVLLFLSGGRSRANESTKVVLRCHVVSAVY